MNSRSLRSRILEQDQVNFVLTNCLPRRTLTRWLGRLSKVEQPLVRDVSIGLWKMFSDVDLSEARDTSFRSLHDCFIRRLREGARQVDMDPSVLASPSDGIVGAFGRIRSDTLLQAKGSGYSMRELLGGSELSDRFAGGTYVTLRLRSSMYHRFHAPHDCTIERVVYFHGDMWNVNPQTLKRVPRLYCRNERAVLLARLASFPATVAIVPVAAVLVASIRLHCIDTTLNMGYDGPSIHRCAVRAGKGEELGWFEHGSTIIVLAPAGFELAQTVREGCVVRMGEPLMQLPARS